MSDFTLNGDSISVRILVGVIVGICLVIAFLFAPLWLNRRNRAARRERPPEQGRLLRPAGHSLSERITVLSEASDDYLFQFFGCGTLLGLILVPFFMINPSIARIVEVLNWYGCLFVLVVIGLAVRSYGKIISTVSELRRSRLGLRGEQAVAESLGQPEVTEAGYRTFHDVPGDGKWNIDHVVVGPAGVFVLETKTRSKRKATFNQEEHVVRFDGQTLQFPWCTNPTAASQAVRNAEWIRNFCKEYSPDGIFIQPIVVVPGWYVKTLGKFEVLVMNHKYLSGFLAREPKRYSRQQLLPLLSRLEQRCRDVEF